MTGRWFVVIGAALLTVAGLVVGATRTALTWQVAPSAGQTVWVTLSVLLVWLAAGATTTVLLAGWAGRSCNTSQHSPDEQ